MKINVNNLDLDKLEDDYCPVERMIKRKKDDTKKVKKNKKENDTYKKEEDE